jgi:hypothetical protein
MLTTTGDYNEYARRTVGGAVYVVTIQSASGMYAFADRVIANSSDTFTVDVLDLIVGDVVISEKCDIISRTWADAEATFTIDNSPFFRASSSADDGRLLRPSDVLGDCYQRSCAIYLLIGGISASVITLFSGVISEYPAIDESEMQFVATVNAAALNKKVPTTVITKATYPNAPVYSINRTMPRVYGYFSEEQFLNHGGLIPCEQIDTNKWAVCSSGQGFNSIDAVWVYCDGLGMWVKLYDDYTTYLSPTGVSWVRLDYIYPKAYAYIYPDSGVDNNTDTLPNTLSPNITDHRGLYLQPDGYQTYYSMTAGKGPGISTTGTKAARIILLWTKVFEKDDNSATLYGTKIGQIITPTSETDLENTAALEYHFHFATGKSNADNGTYGMQFYTAYSAGVSTASNLWEEISIQRAHVVDAGTVYWKRTYLDTYHSAQDLAEQLRWHFGDGMVDSAWYGNAYGVVFAFQVAEAASDGTEIGRLYEARLRIPFRMKLGAHPFPIMVGPYYKYNENIRVAVECSGVKYSASMLNAPRLNPSGHTTSEVITSPIYIIEDILKNVCSMTYDTASFDNAETYLPVINGSAPRRMCAHMAVLHGEKQKTAKEYIIELLRQIPYSMTVNAIGRPRMMTMTGNAFLYTTATEIAAADIDPASFMIAKTPSSDVINSLTVSHMRRPHDGQMSFVHTLDDTSSQSTYGIRQMEGELECDYIGGGGSYYNDFLSATVFRNWLTDKLLSYYKHGKFFSAPKYIVGMFLPGCKWMHLELGDYIKIDPAMDEHMKLFGVSWGDTTHDAKAFMIVEIVKTIQGVRIVAMDPLADV